MSQLTRDPFPAPTRLCACLCRPGFYETPDYVYSTPDASLSDDPITVIIHRNGGNNTG